MNKTTTPLPQQGTAPTTARAWSEGKASGVPNYFIEGRPDHKVTAQPRKGTEPRSGLPILEDQDRSGPERNLAAAVLMQAWLDASGRVYCANGGPGGDRVIAAEAKAFLTAKLPSPWARSRQLYTDLLGVDDECFRATVTLKLAKD